MLRKLNRFLDPVLPWVSPFKPNEVIELALNEAFQSSFFDNVSETAESNADWHRRQIKLLKITSKQIANKTPHDLDIMVIHQAVAVLQLLAYSPRREKDDFAYMDSMAKVRRKIHRILIEGHRVAGNDGWIDYTRLPTLSDGQKYIKPTDLALEEYLESESDPGESYRRTRKFMPVLRAARELKNHTQTKMIRRNLSAASFSEAQTLILSAKEIAESQKGKEQHFAKFKQQEQQKISKLFQRELSSLPCEVSGMWKQKKELKKSFSEDNLVVHAAKNPAHR